MTQEFTDQAIRYFLGELSEAERGAVETRFFADEDYSRFLDRAENDLIDDYLKGKLDFRQVQHFERRFLISRRRREKVRVAQILQTEVYAQKEKTVLPPAPSVAFWRRFENLFRVPNAIWAGVLAATAILILFGGWHLTNPPEENRTAKIERENQTAVEPSKSSLLKIAPSNEKPRKSKEVQKQVVQRAKSKLAAAPHSEKREKPLIAPRFGSTKPLPVLTLLPPMQSAEKLLIAAARNAENIRLRVVHNNAESFVKYLVAIRASDGDLIWSREIAVSEKTLQKPLALDVRSGALIAGSYGLTISGATVDGQLEEVNFFNFTVRKK